VEITNNNSIYIASHQNAKITQKNKKYVDKVFVEIIFHLPSKSRFAWWFDTLIQNPATE